MDFKGDNTNPSCPWYRVLVRLDNLGVPHNINRIQASACSLPAYTVRHGKEDDRMGLFYNFYSYLYPEAHKRDIEFLNQKLKCFMHPETS